MLGYYSYKEVIRFHYYAVANSAKEILIIEPIQMIHWKYQTQRMSYQLSHFRS